MIKKTNYETPLAELLVVRFEENILLSGNGGIQSISGDDVEDDSENWS